MPTLRTGGDGLPEWLPDLHVVRILKMWLKRGCEWDKIIKNRKKIIDFLAF
jgi:hypothetical protein